MALRAPRPTPAVITTAWTKYKAADIGLALPPGVLVVDVDVAKGKQGRADFIRLFGCAAGGNGDGG